MPFPFIGLTTEQNASVTFVNRMGLAKANEALLWGGRLTAEELERNGFVKFVFDRPNEMPTLTFNVVFSKIFPAEDTPSFHKAAREYLLDRLDGLDPTALLSIKRMIQVRFQLLLLTSFKSNLVFSWLCCVLKHNLDCLRYSCDTL